VANEGCPLRLAEVPPGAGVVAVSGGADSVALLWALVAESEGPLIVAHLNHRLRGDDSDADEEFVRLLALSLWLPFRSERIDVRAAAAGDNLESAARRLRYDWLARVARESGASWPPASRWCGRC